MNEHEQTIWRYMTLEKFLSMMTASSLWFSRAAEFDIDPFEAYCNIEAPIEAGQETGALQIMSWLASNTGRVFATAPQRLYISCWFLGEGESMTMWQTYCSLDCGVAVKSSTSRLQRALNLGAARPAQFACGPVTYIDEALFPELLYHNFQNNVPMGDNMIQKVLRLGFYKRKYYDRDCEWRAIIYQPLRQEPGLDMSVELPVLIEEIIVSPRAPMFLREAVEKLVNRFEMSVPVRQSTILRTPKSAMSNS